MMVCIRISAARVCVARLIFLIAAIAMGTGKTREVKDNRSCLKFLL